PMYYGYPAGNGQMQPFAMPAPSEHDMHGAFPTTSQYQGNGQLRQAARARSQVSARTRSSAKSHATARSAATTRSGVRSAMSEKLALNKAPPGVEYVSNGLNNCVTDSVKTTSTMLFVPILMIASSAFFHHFSNRGNPAMLPFGGSKWEKRVNNAMFAISAYGFCKTNGIFGTPAPVQQPVIKHTTARDLALEHSPGTRSLDMSPDAPHNHHHHHQAPYTEEEHLEHIRQVAEEFDARWAVPKAEAKHNYHEVYRTPGGLEAASMFVLGGAAAIRALRKEARQCDRASVASDRSEDQAIMESAMAEASSLLARKAARAELAPDETVENVGRIALATIIQIKTEQCS
ncbi:hypothetical protein H4R18_005816, partial [Coemansia javaensis]